VASQMTTTKSASFGSDSFVNNYADSGNTKTDLNVSVPAAKTGQLTTRTNNTDGVITMAAGHGFVTADKIDIFWTVAGVAGSRRNVSTTVATNAVTITSGSGDNLPANLTNLTACKPTVATLTGSGTNFQALAANNPSSGYGYVVFVDGSSADIAAATYRIATGKGVSVSTAGGDSNPLGSSALGSVKFSHGDLAAVTMKASVLFT